jgi:glutathione peroxidase
LKGKKVKNIYQFKVLNIDGKEVNLTDYKGKTILLVNVASKCGFTKHYKNLTELNEKYKGKNFAIFGFPANEYGGQEPGSNEEIKSFCSLNYAVTFPMFSKVVAKGKNQSPLFQYLTTAENPDFKGDIEWNFEKFLIGPDGQLKHRYKSNVVPTDEKITKAIDELIVK